MAIRNNSSASQGVDWLLIWMYAMLVAIGILCIFMVEYKPGTDVFASFISG